MKALAPRATTIPKQYPIFARPSTNGIEICLCEDPRGGETGRTIEEIALKQDIGEVTVRMALWCVANKVNSFLNEYEGGVPEG